jgi:hypothetical protein
MPCRRHAAMLDRDNLDHGERATVHSDILLFLAAFLASAVEAVEAVEALTIVLAVGIVRGWRSTAFGVGAAAIVLAGVVAILGPALRLMPISTLRLVVGALLLTFGLQWLRKAVLRSGGVRPLHDEAAAFVAAMLQVMFEEVVLPMRLAQIGEPTPGDAPTSPDAAATPSWAPTGSRPAPPAGERS